MRVVVRKTGLKPDLLRAWERRYRAIEPRRSDGSRRLYSGQDIERLVLLRKVIELGHRIGDVASLTDEQLLELMREESAAGTEIHPEKSSTERVDESRLEACLEALEKMDGNELMLRLEQAAIASSPSRLIDQILMPFLQRVGELWESGEFRIAHEHLASSAVRSLLGRMLSSSPGSDSEPLMISTTPARQLHELGALAAAVTAAVEGWRVIYLGPNVPSSEILAAVAMKEPQLVSLSLIYPGDDAHLISEIELLGRHLPPGTRLVFGGRSARGYMSSFEGVGGTYLATLGDLRAELRSMRKPD